MASFETYSSSLRQLLPGCLLIFSLSGCISMGDPLGGEYSGYGIKDLNAASLKKSNDLMTILAEDIGHGKNIYQLCNAPPYVAVEGITVQQREQQCVALRNTMVSVVMLASDEACVAHRRSIYGKDASFNIAAGTFTSFFSGWAAVAPSVHAKAILAALALFANSERSLVNELVYKSTIVPAVDRKIIALREIDAQEIESHFKDSASTYSISTAMRDAMQFHYSCSFMTGLEKVIEEGTQESGRQKLARLNRALAALETKMRLMQESGKTRDFTYLSLDARRLSLVTEITSLEKQ